MDTNLGQVVLVTDFSPGTSSINSYVDYFPTGSYNSDLFESNDQLYFKSDTITQSGLDPFEGSYTDRIYVVENTSEGLRFVDSFSPPIRGAFTSSIESTIEFNDKIYFIALGYGFVIPFVVGLYAYDGTTKRTELIIEAGDLVDNLSTGVLGYSIQNLRVSDDRLTFSIIDETGVFERFVSDGTAEGTRPISEAPPVSDSTPVISEAPHVSDSTAVIFDLSSIGTPIAFNDKLYFSANSGDFGRELFVTDGAIEDALLVADLNSGPEGSNPRSLTVFGDDKLYFTANSGDFGRELFVTGGAIEDALLVADLNSGPEGSNPRSLTVFGDELFFTADNGENGRDELHKLTFDNTLISSESVNPIVANPLQDNLNEIAGSEGDDGITAESGNELLNGNSGNDALDGRAGDDTLDGGAGNDTAVYQFDPNSVTVTLGEPEQEGTASDGYGGTDSLFNLENIIGSEFDDVLTGNSGNNTLTGRRGNDVISGGSGDDFLIGGVGEDTISGGEGSDQFIYFNAFQGRDRINDFVVGEDKIVVIATGFGGGELGSAEQTIRRRLVFDNTSSKLFFDDPDDFFNRGTRENRSLIATLDGVSNLSADDIIIL